MESIDIFKLDVEGLSYEVLESCGDYLAKIKCIQVENEYHQIWEGQKTVHDVYTFLEDRGFELVWHKNEIDILDDSLWVRAEYL